MNTAPGQIISLILILAALQSCSTLPAGCSDGWYVTGYYTPQEADYRGTRSTITIDQMFTAEFPESFLEDVKIEGWGKTRFDWYLGYYSKKWHRAENPLDAAGSPLTIGSAATDPALVRSGSKIRIQSENSFLKNQQFTATDVGQAIRQQHIDIYTGEGLTAKQRTLDITGQKSVCVFN